MISFLVLAVLIETIIGFASAVVMLNIPEER